MVDTLKIPLLRSYTVRTNEPYFTICTDGTGYYHNNVEDQYDDYNNTLRDTVFGASLKKDSYYLWENKLLTEIFPVSDRDKRSNYLCLMDWNLEDPSNKECKVCKYIKTLNKSVVCPACGK